MWRDCFNLSSYHFLEGFFSFEGDVGTPLGLEIDLRVNKTNHRLSHLAMVGEIFPGHVISLRGVIG